MQFKCATPGSCFLVIKLMFISWLATAQFNAGDKFLGGTMALQIQDAPNSPNGGLTNEVRSFAVSPTLGLLAKSNLAIGGLLGYSVYTSKITNAPSPALEYSSHYFSVGIFARRYFAFSDNFLFTVSASGNFERGSEERNYNPPSSGAESQLYQWVIAVRPGLLLFPSPHWGIEASIGTISFTSQMNLSTEEKSTIFNLSYGSLAFGIAYYFRN